MGIFGVITENEEMLQSYNSKMKEIVKKKTMEEI